MMPIAKYLRVHSDNSEIYTPAFINANVSGKIVNDGIPGSIGSYSPAWFGVYNSADSAQEVTIWTITQGTDGTGVTLSIGPNQTFYAQIAKLTAPIDNTIILLGSTNLPTVI